MGLRLSATNWARGAIERLIHMLLFQYFHRGLRNIEYSHHIFLKLIKSKCCADVSPSLIAPILFIM